MKFVIGKSNKCIIIRLLWWSIPNYSEYLQYMDTDLESKCKKINSPGSYLLKWLIYAGRWSITIQLDKCHGLPRWLSSKEFACQSRRCRFGPWVGKIPWKWKWQSTPAFLPGKSRGERSLVSYSPWGHKESVMTKWLNTNNVSWYARCCYYR